MVEDNSRYLLQSVSTALDILDLFIEHDELGATDIANILGFNRSKTFRFLVTLEQSDYLAKTDNNKYRLGAKLQTLGQLVQTRFELISLVHPYLVALVETTGETAHLATMKNQVEMHFIDKAKGSNWLTMDTPIGHTTLAHYTATGKAMLAFSNAKVINAYIKTVSFQKLTDYSIPDAQTLLKVLDEAKENGYAMDSEEAESGLTCFAVPLIVSGEPIAAISVSGPTTRMLREKNKIVSVLKTSAERIQSSLGAIK